jgi:hypothetical protein
VKPIRIIDAAEVAGDARRFHEEFAHQPLIIRNVYPEDAALRRLTPDAIEGMLGAVTMPVYSAESEAAASDVIAGLRDGAGVYNIVDYYIAGTPLGDLFSTPSFLGENWFLGAPAYCDHMEKSLVLSPARCFTSFHVDAYGMQGWMYLIAGCKRWTFGSPADALAAFDPVRKDFLRERLHGTACYSCEMRGGDFLYFPSGWIHEVETTQSSYGVGGSLLNDYQIEEHMRWWLWERAQGFAGPLDLRRVILEMPAERFSGPAGKARAQAALAQCES